MVALEIWTRLMMLMRSRRIKGLANGHIHVEVAVSAEAADEGDLGLCSNQGLVLLEQGFFLYEADGVIGDVVFTSET